MPPVPPDQVSPYGASLASQASVNLDANGGLTHLTMEELACRWRRKRKTIERHYAKWGLRPLRFGGRLLFPISQILEVEHRAMHGEFVEARP